MRKYLSYELEQRKLNATSQARAKQPTVSKHLPQLKGIVDLENTVIQPYSDCSEQEFNHTCVRERSGLLIFLIGVSH